MKTGIHFEHIILDDNNVAVIKGTTTKVVELIVEQCAYGWSPEELHFQHPHLELGKIYAALAYYWNHQKELDQEIGNRFKKAEHFRNILPSPQQHAFLKTRKAG
jgi:uncharacterized protein (DUF433 family)